MPFSQLAQDCRLARCFHSATAKEPLTEVFRLTNVANENVFNVSVNGINGVIEIPTGNYVGSTLATALEERINQIRDPKPVIQLAV